MFRRAKLKQLQSLSVILDSPEMAARVDGITAEVLAGVTDPNPKFMASLRTQLFHTRSNRGVRRVVGQVGAEPVLGGRVEAKRGPLARALGAARG